MTDGNKLVVTTPSDHQIMMTRTFDAPRDLVFEAHTSSDHMRRWWGPRRYEIAECEVDFREGGGWSVLHRGPDGDEHRFHGEFREIVVPEKITWTFEWAGAPGQVSVETLSFEEIDGGTRLTAVSTYDSTEARDGMMSSGMEEGLSETWDRLAEYASGLTSVKSQG